MPCKPRRPRHDPFFLLIIAVALGMAITLFVQVEGFQGADAAPLIGQRPHGRSFRG